MKKRFFCFISLLLTSFTSNMTHACTDFRITTMDRTVLVTRSMEFNIDMQSNVRTASRDRKFTMPPINNLPGKSWQGQYGYIYLDAMNQDIAVDGMNEMGLSVEALYLPGETEYQTVPTGRENAGIPYFYFGDWILSNFKTIDEVRTALPQIIVYAQTLPALGNMIFPLHFSIYDTSGRGIIIEFVKGAMVTSDNEMGVLTNAPTYEWQLTNLRNYLNLTPNNPKPLSVNGMTFASTGQGAGMIGLPGDVSPPARFVKTAFMQKYVYPATNAIDALNVAQHIINNVDIPAGLARSVINNKETSDTTQWVVFKDLTNKIFYYRTYNDMTIRAINLSKINFSGKKHLKMPLKEQPLIMDVTEKFVTDKEKKVVSEAEKVEDVWPA